MRKRCKVRAKNIFKGLAILVLLFITFQINAKGKHSSYFFNSLTQTDTIPQKNSDTAANLSDTSFNDSTKRKAKPDTLNFSKDSLDSPIDYAADDSGVLVIPRKQFFLYGQANTANKDIKLEAQTILYDQQTQLVTAYGGIDTGANPLKNKPKITQQGSVSMSDTIKFNLKTQKGISKNTYYNEGEIFVNASKIKKINKDVVFAYQARFTTCNLDTPHFDIRARKLKLINGKYAVSGPAFPEFEGVPIPIPIPFGIYPLTQGRHSGLLPPTFAQNDTYGLGLENLGYYKVFSDNWDVITRANIYSYGGWKLEVNPQYYKRYHYNGNFDLSIQKTIALNQGYVTPQEFSENTTFHINWFHSMDSKARPGTSFSASVNAGSTQYNQYLTTDVIQNYQNNLSSTINYSKTWNDGKYNFSALANETQNSIDHLIQLGLPTLNFSASTIYPFQKKEQVGTPKWYEKLGISYTGTFINQISFYDTAFNFKRLLDTIQWGAQHSIPITLSLPALGPLIISPSVSYNENWFGEEILQQWDPKLEKVDSSIIRGFFAARQITTGVSLATKIYGTYNFKSGSIKAIRHVITPNISFNYTPSLVKNYYQTVQTDSIGTTYSVSKLVSSLGGGTFSNVPFGGMSFGIDNSLEMKVRDKSDTSEAATKKVTLIDNLSINSGYNFFAPGDSLNWSPISMSFGSTLFNSKMNISGNATIDPYQTDSFGRNINKLWIKNGSIGKFTNGSLSISTSFKSKSKDNRSDSARLPIDETLTPDQQQQELDYVRAHPADFVDFNIPWTVQLGYSLNFERELAANYQYTTVLSSSLSLNGDFSLTPKWKIGGSTYLDMRTLKLETINMFVTRDMHCWQLAINVQVGLYKSFSITLNPKSGVLRDLKINRTRSFSNYSY